MSGQSDKERVEHVLSKMQNHRDFTPTMQPKSFDARFYQNIEFLEINEAYKGKIWTVNKDETVTLKSETKPQKDFYGSILMRVTGIDEYFANPYETVHGGAMVTWLDCLTSLGIYAFDAKDRIVWMSLGITADYINAHKLGKPAYFDVRILKIGKSVAFTEMNMYDQNMKIVSSMTHKKAFMGEMPLPKPKM